MLHLQEYVAAPARVIVKQVPGYLCILCHPVEPDTGDVAATVDVVSADDHVDRAMKLDPGHLCASEKLADVDVMNVVADDLTEGASEAADNPSLLAMMNVVASNDVSAHGRLVPAVLQGAPNAVGVGVGRTREIGVVELIAVFPQRNATAL